MKKKISRILALLLMFSGLILQGKMVNAAGTATFIVKTAQLHEDGTFTVSVYVSGAENVGGIDLSLQYDSSVAEYISSEIEDAYAGGIGETNHLAESSTVKCVSVYEPGITANGEVFSVNFRMKEEGKVTQPTLTVNDFVDGTAEINDIPSQVLYQQNDGSELETPDTSGQTAAPEIQEAVPDSVQQAGGVTGDTGTHTGGIDLSEMTEAEKIGEAASEESGKSTSADTGVPGSEEINQVEEAENADDAVEQGDSQEIVSEEDSETEAPKSLEPVETSKADGNTEGVGLTEDEKTSENAETVQEHRLLIGGIAVAVILLVTGIVIAVVVKRRKGN